MSAVLRRIPLVLLVLPALLLLASTGIAADSTWPREIKTEKGILTVYQPQPEKLTGNIITARAAASFLAPDTIRTPAPANLNRDAQARQQGASRSYGGSSSGGSRGGGGGGRGR